VHKAVSSTISGLASFRLKAEDSLKFLASHKDRRSIKMTEAHFLMLDIHLCGRKERFVSELVD
jgi:hypothetical protein